MVTRSKILVVDDDAHIREVVCYALAQEGFVTCEAADGKQALAAFELESPEVLILDIMMPELTGIEVCQTLRKHSQVPILFLSSRDDELDRILGLELGGDDYITKPFSPRELVARVKAIVRRLHPEPIPSPTSGPTPATDGVINFGPLKMDPERFQVFFGDTEVVLTVTEFAILHCLLRHPGRVYPRERLMDEAYGDGRIVSDRTIDSHVRRVREKFKALGAEPIVTVHGLGYKVDEALR